MKEIKRLQELAGIESTNKYKVVFYDYHDEEYPSKEIFNLKYIFYFNFS